MDLHKVLTTGKELQGKADAGPALSRDNMDQLGDRLEKGLRWLVANHAFQTTAQQEKWEAARATWGALADELDERRGYPQGWTKDELALVMAWLHGETESPLVFHSWDGATVTGGRVVLAVSRFSIPCKVRLPDETVIECVPHYRAGDGDKVFDLFDLLNQFRLQRAFPGAQVVGRPEAYMKLLQEQAV